MPNLAETTERIYQSNISAYGQGGAVALYPEGMLNLIAELHVYENCPQTPSDVDGIWRPRADLIFGLEHLNLYRGAFARRSVGQLLQEGPRGATAVCTLFMNSELRNTINDLITLSRENPAHLACFNLNNNILGGCEEFWYQCAELGISNIYRSKTLSMIFPDLFVPFDTKSLMRFRLDRNSGEIPYINGNASMVQWEGYVNAHMSFKQIYLDLVDEIGAENDNPDLFLRNLSCSSNDQDCIDYFTKIVAQRFPQMPVPPPPPITRFIDKIFYQPGG